MKRWFQNNIWWVSFIIMIAVAMFPHTFAMVGVQVAACFSSYWLQGTLIIIVVLLVIIIVRLGNKDNHAP